MSSTEISNPDRRPGICIAVAQIVAMQIAKKSRKKGKKTGGAGGAVGAGAPAQVNKPVKSVPYADICAAELDLKLKLEWFKSQLDEQAKFNTIHNAWCSGKIDETQAKLTVVVAEKKRLEALEKMQIKAPSESAIARQKAVLREMEAAWQAEKRAKEEKDRRLQDERDKSRGARPGVQLSQPQNTLQDGDQGAADVPPAPAP